MSAAQVVTVAGGVVATAGIVIGTPAIVVGVAVMGIGAAAVRVARHRTAEPVPVEPTTPAALPAAAPLLALPAGGAR